MTGLPLSRACSIFKPVVDRSFLDYLAEWWQAQDLRRCGHLRHAFSCVMETPVIRRGVVGERERLITI